MFRVTKTDEEKRLAFGEVYSPNVIDTHGACMLADDIEVMAHRFMRLQLTQSIDTNHNNVAADVYPVESFIAREGDPDYSPGSWVVGVKVNDDTIWSKIKNGEFNGFSFEAWVTSKAAVAEIEIDPEVIGETQITNEHTHLFVAKVDDDGKVVGGRTSTVNGHSHEIVKASVTEATDGHNHRFSV